VTARTTLLDEVDRLGALAAQVTASLPESGAAAELRERLRRPLRVAIAGRTKAGKSTLLNALVGERLAATDASECTRIVTWYRYDLGYSATARLASGQSEPLDFERSDTALDIRLGGRAVEELERIEVGWPSARLETVTFIDTPGLDSSRRESSRRTETALLGDDSAAGEADAVVYLMRHLHQLDAAFLEAFEGSALAGASPVNAVALLSRSDEIGGGRTDALLSAEAIANRYAADPRINALAIGAIPVAALLAETGASLREIEVAWLREVAKLDDGPRDTILMSADRFRDRAENPLGAEQREQLLARFGMFGLRLAIGELRQRPEESASELARVLVDISGIRAVDALIRRHFADRADVLKARSALARLRVIAAAADRANLPDATRLAGEVERVIASSNELAQLRLLHLVHARLVDFDDDERVEVDRVLGTGSVGERLGQETDTEAAQLGPLAIQGIDRWRTRAVHPALDRRTVEAAESMAREYEGLYQQLMAIPAAR
jgi:50S ribosome-binding GTPase